MEERAGGMLLFLGLWYLPTLTKAAVSEEGLLEEKVRLMVIGWAGCEEKLLEIAQLDIHPADQSVISTSLGEGNK